MPGTPATLDLAPLLESWTVHLRAERKSPQTVKSYTAGVRLRQQMSHMRLDLVDHLAVPMPRVARLLRVLGVNHEWRR